MINKYWHYILLGIVIAIIILPLIVVVFIDINLISDLNTNNDWIGFWGGYLGAIVGGIITLIVMYLTIKDGKKKLADTFEFEKQKYNKEQKTKFNDELLNQLVEFYTEIEIFSLYLRSIAKNSKDKEEVNFIDNAKKLLYLSKLIIIKLEAKKDSEDYVGAKELLDLLWHTQNIMNESLDNMLNPNEFANALTDVIEKLIYEIQKYYHENESESLTIT